MKDVVIIAHYTHIPNSEKNGRFKYLAEILSKKDDISIEVITSDFAHSEKKTREPISCDEYKFTMLHEPPYYKNVCLKRFYSHYILSKNIEKYLKTRKKPDVIYCAVPSLDVALVASKYANKNNIKFIIDVQDIWPEAFKMVFPVKSIADLAFKPFEIMANNIYKSADIVVAVSETYVNRALKVNKKTNVGHSVFLGTELAFFDNIAEKSEVIKPDDEKWIAYIGTLGHSYNIKLVIEAIANIKNKTEQKIKFLIMGNGPLKEEFEKYAKKIDIYCEFTGTLPYDNMVKNLVKCDIAVNPITKGSPASIINKVGDYAASALAVINTQESLEYVNLIKSYNFGIHCSNDDVKGVEDAILKLCSDDELCKEMGKNNRKLAEDKFNRAKTYGKIVDLICD